MTEPVLCYVDAPWAYFTTQALEKQWGDDWDDAPYDLNAGPPYEWFPGRGGEPWEIVRIAFAEGSHWFDLANNTVSVQEINRGARPWIIGSTVVIPAGTPLSEFKRLIRQDGGIIYVEETEKSPGQS